MSIMRGRLLARTMLAGAAGPLLAAAGIIAFPSAASAQEAVQTAAAERETIVVTGTRIARENANAESPIVTVTGDAVEESGYTAVEQYLNTLPQITPNLSSQSNNPSSNGRAFIDLRGLGTGRNLVLVDGRRGMGSTAGGVVDINTIPSALIERVEVITGGAASTYGADAVAGVVNFILKKDFEGVEFDTQYGITEQEDGKQWGAGLTMGGGFDEGRGNAVFSASYYNRDDMYKDARDFAGQASTTTSIFPDGSVTMGANTPSAAAVNALFGAGACQTTGGQSGFGFNPNGSLFCTGTASSPFDIVGYTGPDSAVATRFAPDFFSYNFEPANILVLPMERWSMYTHVDYEVNEYFKPYATAMYTNYNALQELAPTPAGGTTGWNVPVTNPFINPGLASLLATRANPTAPVAFSKRFNALGGRTGYNTHDVWQATAGFGGNFLPTWSYDVYASFGRSVQNEVQGGNVRRDRVGLLLGDDTYYTPGNNQDAPTIAQQATLSGGACPNGLNLFGNAPIDASCAAWISLEAKNLTTVEQSIVEASVTGELFQLPAGAVQLAAGASYRDLSFDFQPDGGLQPGLVAGFNQQLPVTGFLDYTDLFAEVYVPVLSGLPGVEELSFTAGFRTSDNNNTGSADSWKINADWSITDWARFRGGVQQAVRAPNISELYAPQLNNFPTFTNSDPCNTTGTIAATYRNGPNGAQIQALCNAQSAAAGLASYVQPSSQANGITGGNPNLQPETSQSWTAGFVVESPFDGALSGLYGSVDYWSIELEDVIAAVGATTIVQRCYNRDGANPTFDINNSWCQLFNRDPSNGGVIELQQLSQNQAFINTSGVDLTVGYRGDFDNLGAIDLSLIATWVESYETQTTAVDPVYEYTGTIGSTTGSATPEWKVNFNAGYSLGPARVLWSTRYIQGMYNALVVTGGSPVTNTGTDDTYYTDLTGSYDITDSLTLRAGVNNLFDQEPRLYSPNVQSNTDPSVYDVLGRRFFVGLNAKF